MHYDLCLKKCTKLTNYNQLPGAEYTREFNKNRNNSVNVKKIEGLSRHICISGPGTLFDEKTKMKNLVPLYI